MAKNLFLEPTTLNKHKNNIYKSHDNLREIFPIDKMEKNDEIQSPYQNFFKEKKKSLHSTQTPLRGGSRRKSKENNKKI